MIDLNSLNKLKVGDNVYPLIYNDREITNQFYKIIIPCKVEEVSNTLKVFENITAISIYQSDGTTLVTMSNKFNTYSEASIISPNIYKDTEGQPIPALMLTLKAIDLEESVKRLEQTVFPVINFDSMNLTDYKKYYTNIYGKKCQEKIFSGVDVELSNGETKHFSATLEDQNNLSVQFNAALITKGTDSMYPYHADGEQCTNFSFNDIVAIYGAIQKLILTETTYCNALNTYVRSLSDKSEISKVVYGQEIPDEAIVENMNAAIKQGIELLESVLLVKENVNEIIS